MDYIYDNLYRITQFKHNGSVSRNYGYDPNGNLNTFTGKTLTYDNDNNQLTGDGSRTFHFDAAGRVDQINSTALGYDFRNNMVSYGSNTYTYDALGQRIRKTESGTSKYYVTSGQQVLAEYSANSEPDAEYIHALGRMIAKYDPNQGYLWFYVDHLNSTRLMDGSDQG
jgi:YD repeat-containing protein